jgi:hypothetical protein
MTWSQKPCDSQNILSLPFSCYLPPLLFQHVRLVCGPFTGQPSSFHFHNVTPAVTYALLACCAVRCARSLPTFQKCLHHHGTNVGKLVAACMAHQLKWQWPWHSPPWEPDISLMLGCLSAIRHCGVCVGVKLYTRYVIVPVLTCVALTHYSD